MSWEVLQGDMRDVLRTMPEHSVHAVVTDPPYGLSREPDMAEVLRHWLNGDDYEHGGGGFMGKTWDSFVPGPSYWREVYRVLRPGGHCLAFTSTRTADLLGVAMRLAGFERRDTISHLLAITGQGFPKSLDVGKAIDRKRQDDIRPVCRFLRAAVDAHATETTKTIGERFGFHPRMVDHWAARDTDSQPSVPTWDQWLALKALIGFGDAMDAEVWRLNGRKGQPGDAWFEREVVGRTANGAGNGSVVGLGSPRSMDTEYNITAPATDLARQWDGYGTALKPAVEMILVFRKPPGTPIAECVARHGTGALAIDRCRVGTTTEHHRPYQPTNHERTVYGKQGGFQPTNASGRWPPNLVLSHIGGPDGCQPTGATRRVKGSNGVRGGGGGGVWNPTDRQQSPGQTIRGDGRAVGYADPDGTEQVPEYLCHPQCPIFLLDEQAGERMHGAGHARGGSGVKTGQNESMFAGDHEGNGARYGDSGGPSRFFPTFQADGWECVEGCPVKALDEQAGERRSAGLYPVADGWEGRNAIYGQGVGKHQGQLYDDQGGPARFFPQFQPDPPLPIEDAGLVPYRYVPKPSRRERNCGLEGMPETTGGIAQRDHREGEYLDFVHPAPAGIGEWLKAQRETAGISAKALCAAVGAHGEVNHGGAVSNWEREYNRPTPEQWWGLKRALGFDNRYDAAMTETRPVERSLFDDRPRPVAANIHPTTKSVSLMRWLVRLVAPPGPDTVVLDPFGGSGTTAMACLLENVSCILVEQDETYCEIARRRIAHVARYGERWLEMAGTSERKQSPTRVYANGDGIRSVRCCNVCGSQTVKSGAPWPACGHDDWRWIERMAEVKPKPEREVPAQLRLLAAD